MLRMNRKHLDCFDAPEPQPYLFLKRAPWRSSRLPVLGRVAHTDQMTVTVEARWYAISVRTWRARCERPRTIEIRGKCRSASVAKHALMEA